MSWLVCPGAVRRQVSAGSGPDLGLGGPPAPDSGAPQPQELAESDATLLDWMGSA